MWWRKKRSFEDFREEIESHLAIEADEIRDTGPWARFARCRPAKVR